ncbi:MAG: helix-turn-helix domain-containing protein, partial [Bacteroidota bacterium]
GYFAMNQPEIFKLPKTVEKYKDSSLSAKEMTRYKGRLRAAMEEEEVFMNPELTLGELSDIVQTNTHTLSRVINEGYGKSFYDFINEYRVKAFAKLALDDTNKQETFLALALRVGFNSKTTFNRAFKKVTGTTPRSYLKEQREKEAVPVN